MNEKTCAGCSERYLAPKCNRHGWIDFDEADELGYDGLTRADTCLYWKPVDDDTTEKRYEQLEQVAKDMYLFIALEDGLKDVTIRAQGKPRDKIYNRERFSEQLEALGVSVDD